MAPLDRSSRPATRVERFAVPEALSGERLDRVLAACVPGLSRSRARVLLDLGGVFVDGRRVKVAGRPVRSGQTVEATIGGAFARATKRPGRAARARDARTLPAYRMVYEDDDLVVVDKPAGLLAAPTAESDRGNLADLLARRPNGGRVWVVHRLDLPTSGLLVYAKTAEANRALAACFRSHALRREYVAVAAGTFPDARTILDAPLAGRRAVTHVVVERRLPGPATQLRCRLETGRTHQIRIHLHLAGHPVLGDPLHPVAFSCPPPRLALHAAVLGFPHPRTGAPCEFESPLPGDLASWLARLATAGP